MKLYCLHSQGSASRNTVLKVANAFGVQCCNRILSRSLPFAVL
jgi:hypothetical protein